MSVVHERDYLERTIATVRNHRDADNCWPQWANIFADEIERLWAETDRGTDRSMPGGHRLFVNEERTVLVTLWDSGLAQVATRETPDHTWGPPVYCQEEPERRYVPEYTVSPAGPEDKCF